MQFDKIIIGGMGCYIMALYTVNSVICALET